MGVRFEVPAWLLLLVPALLITFVPHLAARRRIGTARRRGGLPCLRESLEAMPDGDAAGVVAFGKDALVERLPEELRTIDRLRSTPVTAATDVGAALRLGSALFPGEMQKRIVLLLGGQHPT